MPEYRAPLKDMLFVMNEQAGLAEIAGLPGFEDASPDLVSAVLEEAGLLAGEVIGPTNEIGDRQGTRIEDGGVRVPAEFTAAYSQYVEGGWPTLTNDPEFGGQGMPHLVGMAVEEMWVAANMAWSLCPLLTQSAIRALISHGSEGLKNAYLPRLVSGEWTGTMNLTEPQAGSDLAAIRAVAAPDGDAFRITGQKIFITWGDHDMTDNVVHLVLARTPDAPEGVAGLSLFVVPKRLLDADGNSGELNNVSPVSVEHKLGIHGSPTCVMSFEGARGFLLGELNRGLSCMFTMMNAARLGVATEGLAMSERSYQQARDYARDRVQGQAVGQPGRVTIIHHPDVRRMLMTMKAYIEAMRGVNYLAAAGMDFAHAAPDAQTRERHSDLVALLTPIVKGWCTEVGQLVTSIGVQVHGGMGYVEETGAAQHFRDARIATIYEGTTGIQANDLVGRKIIRDSGAVAGRLFDMMRQTAVGLDSLPAHCGAIASALQAGIDGLEGSVEWLMQNYSDDIHAPGSVAYNLLMQFGTVCGGWQLASGAMAAVAGLENSPEDAAFFEAKLTTATFYAEQLLPLAGAYAAGVKAGSRSIMALPEDAF